MDHAYMIDHLVDIKRYVYGVFTGGDEGCVEEIEYDGIIRKFDLDLCFQFRIWAPAGLEASALFRLTINSRSKSPPDFGYGPWGGFQLVSESFVDIVENLDPGMHQFIRIPETYIKGGVKIEKTYYIMNVVKTIDAIDIENSNVRLERRKVQSATNDVFATKIHILDPFKLSFFRNKIGNANMWYGSTSDINRLFFSQRLVGKLLSQKLSPLPYMVVDLV